jgi:hypothetical protein
VGNTGTELSQPDLTVTAIIPCVVIVIAVVTMFMLQSSLTDSQARESEPRIELSRTYLVEPAYRHRGIVNSYFGSGPVVDQRNRFVTYLSWGSTSRNSQTGHGDGTKLDHTDTRTYVVDSTFLADRPINTTNDVLN